MTTKDWIVISIIGFGAFILIRKASAFNPLEENPNIMDALKNANLSITINSDELRVMQYADIMMYEGQRQGIAPEIIAGHIRAESSGIAGKKTWEPKVNDYSYGLMQMLPATAELVQSRANWVKYNGDPSSLFSPDVSIKMGTAYLRQNLDKYLASPKLNPITDMIASYNAGTAFVHNGIYTNSVGDPMVQTYVNRVLSYKSRFKMMFEYLYTNYDSLFSPTYWGY